ncbi:MAG: hypothetical protein ACE5FP_10845 [Gemmatimonadota bacterium]
MNYPMLVTLVAALMSAGPAFDPAHDATGFFQTVAGSWTGEGELFGQEAEFAMDWQFELGRKFATLDYSIRGQRSMDAVAYYRMSESASLEGVWFDSRGEILHLEATVTDSTLTTIWRSPTEKGRTTYQLQGESIHVNDYYRDGEDWALFGQARYTRDGPHPG